MSLLVPVTRTRCLLQIQSMPLQHGTILLFQSGKYFKATQMTCDSIKNVISVGAKVIIFCGLQKFEVFVRDLYEEILLRGDMSEGFAVIYSFEQHGFC